MHEPPDAGGDAFSALFGNSDDAAQRRYVVGLRRLNALGRDLVADRSLDGVVARIAEAAKDVARADFAALRLRRDGTMVEVACAGTRVEHPPAAALLSAPVLVGDEVAGELVVANRSARPGFDEVDRAILTELAAHATVAVASPPARPGGEEPDAQELLDAALHEIRTPLTVAKGFLAMLRSHAGELSPEEREHAFEAIARAHERIQRLAEGALPRF